MAVARRTIEADGCVQWLWPEFQNPEARRESKQRDLGTPLPEVDREEHASSPAAAKPAPWPKDTIDQVRAVADLLAASPIPLSIDEIASRFTTRGPWKKRLPRIVEMLVALGRAQEQDGRIGGM